MAGSIPFSEYTSRFSNLRSTLRSDTEKELDAAAPLLKKIIEGATRTAKPASPRGATGAVATGAYLAAWKAVRVGRKGILISNSTSYAAYIDGSAGGRVWAYGRRPGSVPPPHKEIKQWAMVRLGLDESSADKAAWPIAKAIARRGLKARGVLHSDQRNRLLARFMERRFSKMIVVTTRKVMGV